MKIPNKQELQQITFIDSSDIDFKDFIKLYKKFTTKPYAFLVVDAAFALDDRSRLRNIFLERI